MSNSAESATFQLSFAPVLDAEGAPVFTEKRCSQCKESTPHDQVMVTPELVDEETPLKDLSPQRLWRRLAMCVKCGHLTLTK